MRELPVPSNDNQANQIDFDESSDINRDENEDNAHETTESSQDFANDSTLAGESQSGDQLAMSASENSVSSDSIGLTNSNALEEVVIDALSDSEYGANGPDSDPLQINSSAASATKDTDETTENSRIFSDGSTIAEKSRSGDQLPISGSENNVRHDSIGLTSSNTLDGAAIGSSMSDTDGDTNGTETDPIQTSTSADDAMAPAHETKSEYVPYFDIHAANSVEIEDLLDETEEIFCNEDVIMTIGKCGVPKPYLSTSEDIIKREGDKMSGDIAFNESVRIIFVIF